MFLCPRNISIISISFSTLSRQSETFLCGGQESSLSATWKKSTKRKKNKWEKRTHKFQLFRPTPCWPQVDVEMREVEGCQNVLQNFPIKFVWTFHTPCDLQSPPLSLSISWDGRVGKVENCSTSLLFIYKSNYKPLVRREWLSGSRWNQKWMSPRHKVFRRRESSVDMIHF